MISKNLKTGILLFYTAVFAGAGTPAESQDVTSADDVQAGATRSVEGISSADTVISSRRGKPVIRGGYADKPFITRLGGRTTIGGYAEAEFRYDQVAGITEEATFVPRRFNLFTYSAVSDRVSIGSELEIEEMGEEIKLEYATIDFIVHEAVSFRGGVILSPLGKFNLAHDAPFNDLVDRPLVSTEIIPTALSEPGMGLFGALYPSEASRITYEIYGVNGFNEGLLEDSDRTTVPNGKGTVEDNNNHPSFVGRVSISPREGIELGGSFHAGPYNVYEVEGLKVAERQNLSIFAIDYELRHDRWELLGEYARAHVDIPNAISDLFARRQQGIYAQVNSHFGRGFFSDLPHSLFTGTFRYDFVDFDSEATGDSQWKLTFGLNFRPTEDTVFKLNYIRGRETDAVPLSVDSAAFLFGVATYF